VFCLNTVYFALYRVLEKMTRLSSPLKWRLGESRLFKVWPWWIFEKVNIWAVSVTLKIFYGSNLLV